MYLTRYARRRRAAAFTAASQAFGVASATLCAATCAPLLAIGYLGAPATPLMAYAMLGGTLTTLAAMLAAAWCAIGAAHHNRQANR